MKTHCSIVTSLALLHGSVSSLFAQGVLLEKEGAQPEDHFAAALENIGDLDADGVDDLAVSSTRETDSNRTGMIQAISGRDGSILFTTVSTVTDERFGTSLCRAGDVNGDGVRDLAVGATEGGVSPKTGRALVLSGTDGSVLWECTPPNPEAWFGTSVDARADLDGDSVPDLLVGGGPYWGGAVRLLSGSTGSLIREQMGSFFFLGFSVAYLGDLDLDGVVDYAAADPWELASGVGYGVVHCYSGASGQPIRNLVGGLGLYDGYGESLADMGDVNLDGISDLAVGSQGYWVPGKAQVVSGSDGALLHETVGRENELLWGRVRATPDLDADGIQDLLIPRLGYSNPLVVSGGTGAVIHMTHSFGGVGSTAVLDQNLDGVLDYVLGYEGHDPDGASENTGRLQVINGRCGSVESYSERCSPAFFPNGTLTFRGRVLEGDSVSLHVNVGTGGHPGLWFFVVVGLQDANLPLGSSCFLRVRPDLIQPIALRGDRYQREGDFPDQIPVGIGPVSWYSQLVLGNASSLNVSNAIRIDVP